MIGSSGPLCQVSADGLVHLGTAIVVRLSGGACLPQTLSVFRLSSHDSSSIQRTSWSTKGPTRDISPLSLLSQARLLPLPCHHHLPCYQRSRPSPSQAPAVYTMSSSLTNHNASNYARHANFVYSAEYASPVLNLLNPQAGERIADLGCGTGELTAQIAKAVGNGGFVFGVDSSESMVCSFPILEQSHDVG